MAHLPVGVAKAQGLQIMVETIPTLQRAEVYLAAEAAVAMAMAVQRALAPMGIAGLSGDV